MGINDLRRTPKTRRPSSQYSYMHTRGSRQAFGLDAHPGTLHYHPDITKREAEERKAARAARAAAKKGTGGTRRRHRKHRSTRRR